MTDRLGHKQTAAMLALLVLAREVRNPDLEAVVGFRLSGKERIQLNDSGLVTSRRDGQAYAHELTDDGRNWCRAELAEKTPPAPRPHSVFAPALYVLLGGLDEYLRRENLALTDMFPPDVQLTSEEIEQRVRSAYRKLARSPRDWVELVDLRPLLGNAPAKDVDEVLKALSRKGKVNLVPKSNRKMLTDADHRAAIHLGGEENHRLSIEAS